MPVTISREELYAKVWGQPMIHLASEFGMSDVGLKKICVKHRIPVPPRGYWAKKASGKKVTKTALRKLSDPAINRIVIHGNSLGSLHREVVEAAERAQELAQRMDEQFQSGTRSVTTHPLVERIRKRLEKARPGKDGFIVVKNANLVSLRITQDSRARVISFLQTFISEAEARGYALKKGDAAIRIIVDGEPISFLIEEGTDRIPHEPTKSELNKLKRWENYRGCSARGSYREWVPKPDIPEWDRVPNGRLKFRIDSHSYARMRKSFSDGKRQKLENLTGSILAAVATHAAAKKVQRREDELRRIEREKQARLEEERRKIRALEEKRVQALSRDIERSRQQKEILEYVSLVEARLQASDVEDPETTKAWIEWAREYADRLDPIQDEFPRLLQAEDFNPWEL